MFPEHVGDFSGKTFEECFLNPKWTECIRECWEGDKCTGMFREYYEYVMERLKNTDDRKAHETRCRNLCKQTAYLKLPGYLLKYRDESNGGTNSTSGIN